MQSENSERLNSIRRRIKMLRAALEDPTLLTSVSVDGVAETFDRASAREELRELELEEGRLSGATSRVQTIGWRR
ncbi:MAG: hypothetical protein IJE97_16970 [Thermoguttaceae bacterium]|nr:hypothetical protein [Thermoguttaceae bacterium]MBQ5790398.1 hypothetical protein [Thermoguttaceae bacterium]